MAALLAVCFNAARAVSFSADAVQIRHDDLSHGRVYWSDNRVRFEYLDQGVQMVHIYDSPNNRKIWLDTENKVFIERNISDTRPEKLDSTTASELHNPCQSYRDAECVKLKSAEINRRETDKWLITFDVNGRDEHMFQWIDKQFRIPVRQENPDGSIVDVRIIDDLELYGRKVHKFDMLVIAADGNRGHSIEWYDAELGVVVRQQDEDGTVEELRNIRLEPVAEEKFAIPEGYEALDTRLSGPDGGSSIIFKTAQN